MKYILIFMLLIMITGCADQVSFEEAKNIDSVGFWYGLWHGMIASISWLFSLFSDNIAVYAIYNNGGWYDFGFLIGVGGFTTAATKSSN